MKPTSRSLLLPILSASLGGAFLEGILGVLPGDPAFASLSRTLLSVGVSALLLAALQALLHAATLPFLRILQPRSAAALPLALGAFLGFMLILGSSGGILVFPLYTTDLVKWTLVLLASTAAAGGVLLAARKSFRDEGPTRGIVRVQGAVPLACALLFLAIWWLRYGAERLLSARTLAALALLLAAGGALLALSRFLGRESVARAVLSLLAIPLLLVPGSMIYRESRPVAGHLPPGAMRPSVSRVLLITIDTLRADLLQAYGSTKGTTPAIDALAEEGFVFLGAHAPSPWTLPSVASIHTGADPLVHRMLGHRSRLPEPFTTLAERFRESGYYTAAIGANPYLKSHSNLSQGFSEYSFYGGVPRIMREGPFGGRILRRIAGWSFPPWGSTPELTGMTRDWLGRNAELPFFLWVHYLDPHVPYGPPEAYQPEGRPAPAIGKVFSRQTSVRSGAFIPDRVERDWIRALYRGEAGYVDANVDLVLKELKRLGLYEETLIVLTSDHGEEFWEHGGYEHGHTLHEELLKVPLLLKLPGGGSGRLVPGPVTLESLAPTLLDLCGIPYEEEDFSAGSLVPLLRGETGTPAGSLLATGTAYYENRSSVRIGDYKYIRWEVSGREELFDLASDPGESRSLDQELPEVLEGARKALEARENQAAHLRRRLGAISGAAEELPDPEVLEGLKSLGYVE